MGAFRRKPAAVESFGTDDDLRGIFGGPFRLLLDGPQCVLVHDRTGMRWLLFDTDCVPE